MARTPTFSTSARRSASRLVQRYGIGDKVFTGPNPPYGALITYYLREA